VNADRTTPGHPLLYELPARPLVARLSDQLSRPASLADVPDEEIDRLAALGFDYVWLMGVWDTGMAGGEIARRQPWLGSRWRELFGVDSEPEIVGSPYAIASYRVAADLGGDEALARLRQRLARAGIGLILDFVNHHTAVDHPWIAAHPDWYVAGAETARDAEPDAWFETPIPGTRRWLAHCRDPHFPPWTDTAPLDYRNPEVHQAMTSELLAIAERCDGVRCDMAMLTLADVFRSTWGDRSLPPARDTGPTEYWSRAVAAVHATGRPFVFIAEAYWDLEWRLQDLGFDYTYDKRFLDRARQPDGRDLVAHLWADPDYQRRSVRFLENHDEDRAAAVLTLERHAALALVAATVPGMFLVQDGQLAGARLRAPVQFGRRPDEPIDNAIRSSYEALFDAIAQSELRHGSCLAIRPLPAWAGNPTHETFVARLWRAPGGRSYLAVANLGATAGQCSLRFPLHEATGRTVVLADLLGDARYERSGDHIVAGPGLYVDLPASGRHLFVLTTRKATGSLDR
jgi:hypothetical protein